MKQSNSKQVLKLRKVAFAIFLGLILYVLLVVGVELVFGLLNQQKLVVPGPKEGQRIGCDDSEQ